MEAATLLPPLFPMVEIEGILNSLKYSFDSAAPTNPTGTPTTNLGSSLFSFTNSKILKRAVGALPITKQSIPSATARSTAQADLVVPSSLDVLNRSEEHTSELQSRGHLVCRLLLEKKKLAVWLP